MKTQIFRNKKGEAKMRVYVQTRKVAWTSKVISEMLVNGVEPTKIKKSTSDS